MFGGIRPMRRGRGAFTLVEILVAISVLVLVLVLFSQILTHVTSVTTSGRKRLDADAGARAALDQIGRDLSARVRRLEAGFLVSKKAGSDAFYFFAEAPGWRVGTDPADTIALVGYRVDATNGLERVGQTLPLEGSNAFSGLADDLAARVAGLSANAAEVQILAPEVVRMEVEFLPISRISSANMPTRETSNAGDLTTLDASGEISRRPGSQIADLSFASLLVVTIACVDPSTRRLVQDAGVGQIAAKFPDAVDGALSSGGSGTDGWSAIATESRFGLQQQSAAGLVRVYRRFYPLND